MTDMGISKALKKCLLIPAGLALVLSCAPATAQVSLADSEAKITQGRQLTAAHHFPEAETLLNAALTELQALGHWSPNRPDHSQLDLGLLIQEQCKAMSALVDLYVAKGDMATAEALEEKLISMREDAAGDTELAAEYNNAASIYFRDGKLDRAQFWMAKLFDSDPQYYHPGFQVLHNNYRKILQSQNNTKELAAFEAKLVKRPAPRAVASTGGAGGPSGSTERRFVPSREQTPQGETLNLDQAREYMLSLINRDRAAAHLPPVAMDPVAMRAAQLHAEDTAKAGYNDHYDLDGRSPDWRYVLVGGTDMIAENQLGVYYDPKYVYNLPKDQRFTKEEIEHVESVFFDEKPPQDGHRKNILQPRHNKVGIGLSVCWIEQPYGGFRSITCCQEFVDGYGAFSPLPLSAEPGQAVSLIGKLAPGLELYTVDIQRGDLPKPIPIEELRKNAYHGYNLPDRRIASYWPRDVQFTADGHFRLMIPIEKDWKPGLYYMSVWVTDGHSDPFVTSRQIVAVGSKQPITAIRN